MAHKTWFDRLLNPQEQAEFTRLRREKGWTIAELHAWLIRRGVEIGETSVWRQINKIDEWSQRIRDARELALGIIERIEEDDDDQIGRANLLLLSARVQKILTQGGNDLGVEEIATMAHALAKMAQAAKAVVDRAARVRSELAQQLDRLEGQARDGSSNVRLDPDTIRYVRETLYGA